MSTTKIKQLLDSADKADSSVAELLKKSNVNRWEASRLIAEALDSKVITQVILAKELSRSQPFIAYYRRVWKKFESDSSTMEFQEAYRWVQDNPEKPRPKPTETVTISAEEAAAKAEAEAEKKRNAEAAKAEIEEVRAANAARKAAAEAAANSRPAITEAEKKAKEAEKAAFVDGLTAPINGVLAAMGMPCAVGTFGEGYDELVKARDAFQGVFDRGDPVTADHLKDAYEIQAQVTELQAEITALLMKLELLTVK